MYIVDFHADIADVCADIAEIHADVRNFSQCPLHVRRASADIWDTGLVESTDQVRSISNLTKRSLL